MKFFKQTLDLDTKNKEELDRILHKVTHCPFDTELGMSKVPVIRDTRKGYHVILHCAYGCDTCRFVFDDPKRYAIDFRKPRCTQNVLFEPFSAYKIRTGGRGSHPTGRLKK